MKHYVVGFAFSGTGTSVILITKNRPKWQEDLLNGVGGRVEEDESPKSAMVREFKEETGVLIEDWTLFCTLSFEDSKIWYFYTSSVKIHGCKTTTDEVVMLYNVDAFICLTDRFKRVPNLSWLIPLALDNAAPKPLCNQVHAGLKNKYAEGTK